MNIRSYTDSVRERLVGAVTRIVNAEAQASGAAREPEISRGDAFPVLVNDAQATARTLDAFRACLGDGAVIEVPRLMGSEDVGNLAAAAGAPLVYWLLGGADPALFADAALGPSLPAGVPSNHSPFFAPLPEPTLRTGIAALVTAALTWLDDPNETTSKGER